jgi:hypothetical protein
LADEHLLASHGVDLRQWGPDPASGKVEIFLARYTAAAAALLTARYGAAVIVAPTATGLGVRLNRRNDSAPFDGGDDLSNGCSSGPVVLSRRGNTSYVLSAGHCSKRVGQTIHVGGNLMGKVIKRELKNHGLDSEMINDLGGGYNGSVWGGGPNEANPPVYAEDGALFAKPGTLISNDSAVSGQINGIKVLRVNQMFEEGGITTIDLTEVYKHGHPICRGGDSGGPWIKLMAGGLAKIVGTTVLGVHRVSGGFKYCFIQQINSIMRAFNVRVP